MIGAKTSRIWLVNFWVRGNTFLHLFSSSSLFLFLSLSSIIRSLYSSFLFSSSILFYVFLFLLLSTNLPNFAPDILKSSSAHSQPEHSQECEYESIPFKNLKQAPFSFLHFLILLTLPIFSLSRSFSLS